MPELFTRRLTDKDTEAVANKALFNGQKGADRLATRDYQQKNGRDLCRMPSRAETGRHFDRHVYPQGHRRLGCV